MERNQTIVEVSILSVPTELLPIILSYLSSRDKAKLRYVSQRLQIVSEIPSLWREFVWDYYDTREELCVRNLLKRYGEHIKRLAFPGYLTPKLVMKLSPDQLTQLGEVVQHMKHLHTLDIGWNTDIAKPLLLIGSNLRELTLYSGLQFRLCFLWVNEWVDMGFRPANLNIVLTKNRMLELQQGLVQNWQQWNSKVPENHTANFKLYGHYSIPLNLYPVVPIFQLQFGQTAVLPFVQAKQFGIQGLDYLQLTDCCRDGKMVYKATNTSLNFPQSNSIITSLRFSVLTQFEVAHCSSFFPSHLEQLAVVCPNLQQLVLYNCTRCLINLRGLHAIAGHCHNLRGLNITGISITEFKSQIQFWEILSNLKLTHLSTECCVIGPRVAGVEYKEKLISLYQKCSSLVALDSRISMFCGSCGGLTRQDLLVPCQFPYLKYLKVNSRPVQDIITNCKEIKCFRISGVFFSDPAAFVCNNLQQLFIYSKMANILTNFMSSVSAHGGLVHVFLSVASVSAVGISVLIENSPKLLTFYSVLEIRHENDEGTLTDEEWVEFEHSLKQKYHNKKIFNVGGFIMLRKAKQGSRTRFLKTPFLGYTDLQLL
ncbi:uncharacterized protein [Dysidea avara]|uniref:uncharacterized protein n=1 Tax=Dysidea avara TaxID=196820 RepID=UPI003322E905